MGSFPRARHLPSCKPSAVKDTLTSLDYDSSNEIPADGAKTGCACLPNLYSTLALFQSMPAPSFPYSMGLLKKTTRLGHDVVGCQICPNAYNTAVQNSMLLGTLLQILINEYAKLLKYIDERSVNSDKIPFHVGEQSSLLDSRHTRIPNCPMAISIDFSGEDWRTLARKAISQEVLGSSDSGSSLIGLVDTMKNRQNKWHERQPTGVHVASHDHDCATQPQPGAKANDMCVQATYVEHLKKSIKALGL